MVHDRRLADLITEALLDRPRLYRNYVMALVKVQTDKQDMKELEAEKLKES